MNYLAKKACGLLHKPIFFHRYIILTKYYKYISDIQKLIQIKPYLVRLDRISRDFYLGQDTLKQIQTAPQTPFIHI